MEIKISNNDNIIGTINQKSIRKTQKTIELKQTINQKDERTTQRPSCFRQNQILKTLCT